MQDTSTTEVTIPQSQIADVETFEELRQEVMGETAGKPTEQAITMADLVAATSTADGAHLIDTLQARAQAQENRAEAHEALQTARERLGQAIGHTASREDVEYRFVLDPHSGEVTAVRRIINLPEDTKGTKDSQRLATRVGYGPQTNRASLGHQTHVNYD